MIKTIKLTVAAAAALTLMSAPVTAKEYYAGKTLTVQVPSGSGGTYHVYCQLVQRNLANYIPGNPKTLIQNRPGAGGAKSASYMANVAPKDGSVIAMIAPGVITTPLVRKVKFDARKFVWLGAPAARAAGIFMWHTSGIKNLKDFQTKKSVIASSGFASSGSIFPRLVSATLGSKMKIILGYKGGGAMNLSIEKKETMGRNNFLSGFTGVRPTWLPQKKIIPIIMYGPKSDSKYVKGVPHLDDMVKPGTIEAKMVRVLSTNLQVGQAFYLPEGTPKNVTKIMRTAFAKMMADPVFKDRVEKRRVEHSPVSVKEINSLIKAGFEAATPDVVKAIKLRLYTKKKS
jgi:tripartite-type tricarboxylate transporter receptor subunit TctC